MASGRIIVSSKAEIQLAIRLGFDPADFRVKATVRCRQYFMRTRQPDLVFVTHSRCVGVFVAANGEVTFDLPEDEEGPRVRVKALGPWTLELERE